mgnify:CR=1 FL=1
MAFPLTMPTTPIMNQAKVSLVRQTAVTQSPYSGATQRSEGSYALWEVKGGFPEMDDLQISRLWRSFFLQLRGRAGTFKLIIPGTGAPSTAYTGAVGLVDGASQTGLTLVTKTWDNTTLVLQDGDYFTVNDELKILTADATTDGAGAVTLSFEPPLRTSPADGAALTIANPYFIARLQNDDPSWNLRPPYFHAFAFEATENF